MSRSIDLFRIVMGSTIYTLTSASDQQTHNAEDYEPVAIGRGGVSVKNELSKANLDVRLSLAHALAQSLLSQWTEQVATITIFAKRTAGTDVIWKGRLTSVSPEDDHIRMTFESIFTSMRRPGLRARFQKNCRHALYGRGCWLDPEDFDVDATVTIIDGLLVTSPEADALADGYFTGGMIRAPDGTLAYIAEHTGAILRLNRVSASLAAAYASPGPPVAVKLYPGCNHSYGTCRDKFANDDNYGGFDYIPTKNPMGGSSIV